LQDAGTFARESRMAVGCTFVDAEFMDGFIESPALRKRRAV
jgi:hypothetical protein